MIIRKTLWKIVGKHETETADSIDLQRGETTINININNRARMLEGTNEGTDSI